MANSTPQRPAKTGLLTLLLVGLLAIGALIVYANLDWVERTVTVPPSLKVTSNRYYTAEQLLQKSGYPVKKVNDTLSLNRLPLTATLVLFNSDLLQTPSQRNVLKNWIKLGGHLVLAPRTDQNSVALQESLAIYVDDDEDDDDIWAAITVNNATATNPVSPASSQAITVDVEGHRLIADIGKTQRFYVDQRLSENVADADEPELSAIARYPLEHGWISVVPLTLFTNSSIQKHDHAKLWLLVSTLENRHDTVYFARYANFPHLLRWLIDNAPYALFALGLCLLLLLWRYIPRFGALIPLPPPVRPSLTEHLTAVATYQLQQQDYNHQIAPLREDVLRLLAPLRLRYSDVHSDAQLIANVTAMDVDAVNQALTADVRQLNHFTQYAACLCQLTDRLNALQNSTGRR